MILILLHIRWCAKWDFTVKKKAVVIQALGKMLAAALGSFKLGRFLHGFAHYIAVYNIYVAQRMYANYSAVCAETV